VAITEAMNWALPPQKGQGFRSSVIYRLQQSLVPPDEILGGQGKNNAVERGGRRTPKTTRADMFQGLDKFLRIILISEMPHRYYMDAFS
jgi:hypothetical protein